MQIFVCPDLSALWGLCNIRCICPYCNKGLPTSNAKEKHRKNKKTESIEKPARLSFNDNGFQMLNVDQSVDVWEKINLQ